MQGDDLRRYLQYQAYRAIGSFEILEGVPAAEVHARMTEVRKFLRIPEILPLLPAAPPPPPSQIPPAPTPASPAAAPAAPAPEPTPLPPPRNPEYPDQTVAAAGHSVPEFGGMFPPGE